MNRYDVVYHSDHVSIESHFCREWDEDGGCYGSNPNHGFSWEEACKFAAEYHTQRAAEFANADESEYY